MVAPPRAPTSQLLRWPGGGWWRLMEAQIQSIHFVSAAINRLACFWAHRFAVVSRESVRALMSPRVRTRSGTPLCRGHAPTHGAKLLLGEPRDLI